MVVGDHDETDPELSRAMMERIAGSKMAVIPNSGHMNFVDQPAKWLKAVGDFLAH